MTLSHRLTTVTQKNIPVSDLILTVEYDENERTVEAVKAVATYNYHAGVTTDVTAQFMEHFDDQLDSIINNVNWPEVHAGQEAIEEVCS